MYTKKSSKLNLTIIWFFFTHALEPCASIERTFESQTTQTSLPLSPLQRMSQEPEMNEDYGGEHRSVHSEHPYVQEQKGLFIL